MQRAIPLIVLFIAALLGFNEYQNCRLVLPGLATPSNCGSAQNPNPPAQPPITPPNPTPQPNPEPAPQTNPPAPTPPVATPQPATPTATTSTYAEATMTTPDNDPSVNLRTERKNIFEAYNNKNYADAIGLADNWLNSRPTDALMAMVRSNALAKQIAKPTITIGLSVPTSGKSVQAGEAVMQGVNMAVQEVNKEGGIDGKRVVVEIRNDQNDRALAVKAASSLLDEKSVLGVIGPVNSSSTLAAADIYGTGLAHIAPTATDDRLANTGAYTYRLAPSNSAQGTVLARLAKTKGFIRIPVFFDPNDAYSKNLSDAFIRECEANNISTLPIEFASGSLPSEDTLLTFEDSPTPDAVFLSGSYTDVAAIAKQLREHGVKVPFLAGDAAYSQQMLQAGGEAVEGLTLLSFFHASSDVANTKAFVKKFAARYGGGTPNARAAQSYDATRTLLEAIRREKTPSRENVKAALDGFTAKPGPGVTSEVAFKKGAIQGRPFVIIEVQNNKLVATGSATP